MEAFGDVLDQDWESQSKMFTSDHFLLHLNSTNNRLWPNCSEFDVPVDVSDAPIELFDMSLNYTLQESTNSIESKASADFLNTTFVESASIRDIDAFVVLTIPDEVMEEILQLKAAPLALHGEMIHGKRMHDEVEAMQDQDKDCLVDQNAVKKARMSGGQSAQRNKSIPMPKRDKKGVHLHGDEEETSTRGEEDSNNNASKGGSTSESKTRKGKMSRGGATDPQSLYARRRRERINERLRILQVLVPNGTKVDISTMLAASLCPKSSNKNHIYFSIPEQISHRL